MTEKTQIRKTLEELEDDVHKSWLRDLDKVKEFHSLYSILDEILKKDTIEEYFQNNASDVQYFLNKFTTETVSNILRQPFVYGPNGDDVAFSVLQQYLRIFLKFMNNPNYAHLWDSIKDIFDSAKSYYKGTSYTNTRILNENKIISAEKFNERILPKDSGKKNKPTLNVGDIIDVLIDNKKPYNAFPEKKIWTRGMISKVDKENEYFVVGVAEEPLPIFLKNSSTEYLPVGTMTKDYDWRMGIKECKYCYNIIFIIR